MDTQVSNFQGVCKDCGNVYDERNDVDVLVCIACGSSHVDVL